VAKIQKVVKDIAADPMSFANNLMAGIGQGFQQFFDNIGQHLIKGMLEWLLSGMKDAGLSVAVPRDFSMRSVVMFFLDLLGISWPRIRMLLVEQLGEKTVAILETAGGAIAAVMTKGLSGIWEEIQQMLEPKVIIDAIIDAAIKYITETVIVKVAARIIAMLNPAGAILAAVEAIYRVLKWIFNNAARIFRLVEAVVNGMADVIAGNIQGVANMVENALGMLIAPVIDFIADYIGLGGLPAKVADAVKGLQAWVEGILRKVIAWLVAQGKKLLAALGIKEKEEDKDKDKKGAGAGEVGERVPFSGGSESHTLYVKTSGANATLMVESTPITVEAWLAGLEKEKLPKLEAKQQKEASSLMGQARSLLSKTDQEADQVAKAQDAVKSTSPSAGGAAPATPGVEAAQANNVVKADERDLATVLGEIAKICGEGTMELLVKVGDDLLVSHRHRWLAAVVSEIKKDIGVVMCALVHTRTKEKRGIPLADFINSFNSPNPTVVRPFGSVPEDDLAAQAEEAAQKHVEELTEKYKKDETPVMFSTGKALTASGFDVAALGRMGPEQVIEELILGEVKFSQGRLKGETAEMVEVSISAAKVTATAENLPQNIVGLLDKIPLSQRGRILNALRAGHVRFPLFTAGKAKFTDTQLEKIEQNVRKAMKIVLRRQFDDKGITEEEIEQAVSNVKFPAPEKIQLPAEQVP
jgi:hypothetical protein